MWYKKLSFGISICSWLMGLFRTFRKKF